MVGHRSRILILVAVLATAGLGVGVYYLQNSAAAMGGRISLPKLAWLLYTVLVWGLLCPILAFEPRIHRSFRLIVGVFAALMWARAAAELPMLYVWQNWRPPYGMAQDVVCALVIGGQLLATRGAWWPTRTRGERWMLAFILVLVASVLIECTYAWLFYRAVEGATTGTEGLWFAAPGDPRFTLINRLTLAFDLVLYAFLAMFLWNTLRKFGNALPSSRGSDVDRNRATRRMERFTKASPLRPATRSDNAALLDLFASVPMSGSLELSTRRDPDFFGLYDMQRGTAECSVYERQGRIVGSGTVLVRDGWLDGQPERVGYLGDLRSTFAGSRDRGLIRIYGDVLDDTARRHQCERYLTAVLASNTPAIQALVRRRSERATQPRYQLFRRFTMVSIQFAGRRRMRRPSHVVRRARTEDLPSIVALLDRDHRQRPFGYRYDQGEFEHRLKHWPGMALEHTYVAHDTSGRVVGVATAWDPAAVKRYRVLAYRGAMRWTRRAWNLAARLLRSPRLPEPGQDFRYLYLCNVSVEDDRPEVLRSILEQIYADFAGAGYHFFSLCVYQDDPLAPALRGFLTRRLDFHLYMVSRAQEVERPLPLGRPGFEMALA